MQRIRTVLASWRSFLSSLESKSWVFADWAAVSGILACSGDLAKSSPATGAAVLKSLLTP